MSKSLSLGLAEEALLGRLLVLSHVRDMPARAWPLAAACQVLATKLPKGSEFRRAAVAGSGDDQVELWLCALAAHEDATREGRGLSARWQFSEPWIERWSSIAEAAPPYEDSAWSEAVQALVNCRSIAAKVTDAALRGSGPSASPT